MSEVAPRDVILTGLPRSGTTLTCHLLNKLPDVVALHEPMEMSPLLRAGAGPAGVAEVRRFFATTRESLRTRATAISKQVGGAVPDNWVEDGRPSLLRRLRGLVRGGRERERSRLRRQRGSRGLIRVEKPLSPDFTLAIKHPAAFTALLEPLVAELACYAVVRNPLAVLASWNSVRFPVQQGHAPVAESLDAQLGARLERIDDRIARQLELLDWFYARYAKLLPEERVIRYEEMVSSGGRTLVRVHPAAAELAEPLEPRNANPAYDATAAVDLAERLLAHPGAWRHFYDVADVRKLAERFPTA